MTAAAPAGAVLLSPEHRQLIEASGISADIADARGYLTVTRAEARRRGFGDFQAGAGLLIPLYNVHGEAAGYQLRRDDPRIKDGKPVKYETPSGFHMCLDVPPAVRPLLGDPAIPLLITEGARKADSAVSQGLAALDLLGVWNWRGTNAAGGKLALPDWDAVALNGRTIYLAFDSDAMQKAAVHAALRRLKEFLESRAAHVHIVYLPPGPQLRKTGLDDFFARGGSVAELYRLARPELLPLPGGDSGGGYGAPGDGFEPIEGAPTFGFMGAAPMLYQQAKGDIRPYLSARPVVRRHGRIDGLSDPSAHWYELALATPAAPTPAESDFRIVSGEQLDKGSCWPALPHALGWAGKGNKALLANAVLHEAAKLRETPGYNHLGWVELDDGWHYLLPDGRAIPALPNGEPAVIAGVPERLRAAAEAVTVPEPLDLATVRRALAVEQAASPTLQAPLLAIGASVRSLLWALWPADTGVLVIGPEGVGKGAAVAEGKAMIIAPPQPRPYPPIHTASFSDTPARVEAQMDAHQSMPADVDDAALGRFGQADEAAERNVIGVLERVFRPAANGGPMRGRQTRTMEAAHDYYVRCVPLATLERLPEKVVNSLVRRVVLIELAAGDVDTAVLKAAGKDSEHHRALRSIGHAVIAWAASEVQRMGLDAFAAEREDRREGWEAYLAGQLGDAVPAALGSITANWSQVLAGLDLVEQVLALAPGELTAPAVAAALPQIQTQVERVLNPGAADGEGWPVFFLALMYDELAAHKAHLTDRGGGLPGGEADRDALGWERQPDGTWRPRGPKLGYCLQDGRTGLLPDVAYERFAARARADRRVPPGKAELLALLDRAGVIEVAHEEGRRQPRRTLRLWHDGPRLIVLQHGDGFLGERGNGGTPADDGPHACLSTPEPAPMAPFPRSPVPPAQAALCAENGAHCSPAEEAAAPAGAAPVSIGAGACSPGAATPDGGSTRCDRDSCGLALAESRDAAWGGWCLGHAARGQLLSLASIAEPEPWPRLPLGAGNAVAAGPDAWQQFARVADDERLALALRRLLGEPDPPASVPPVPAATGERDYRDAWRARGAALIHAGGRCPDCGREERVRLSSGEWACASCTSPPDGDPPPTERPADDAPRPSHPRRLATLGADGLYLMAGEKPQRLDVPPPGDVGALLDLMARMDVRQLWIHASTLAGLGLPAELPRGENGRPRDDVPHPFFAAAGGWDIAGPALRWWYRARRDGLSLQIAIPAYNVLKGNWGGCWDTPATAGALLVALSAFSHALGMLPVGGPGRTGEALLRRLLRTSPTGRELTAITPPPPALAGRREGDLAWMRPLTDAERAAGFVHSFDRNAQYLSVMGSLSVGIGEPEYRTGPDLAFDRKLPGYWHAVITAELPANLPDPFPCDPAGRWYTTPTLELAAQLGARITLREAYVWPEHSRLLERWYRIVREARLTLSGPAREAVKALYTQFIGHLESRIWEREGEAFYRPDIRQLIIAQARVNFWRILRRCADEGRPPVLVYVDEALFVGESADPLSAKPAAIALGPDLASFKHSASTPLADVLPAWEGPRLNPVKVLELLKGSEGVE